MLVPIVEVADPATPPAARPLRWPSSAGQPASRRRGAEPQDAVLVAVDLIDRLPTLFGLSATGSCRTTRRGHCATRCTTRWSIGGCALSATSTSVSTCPWPTCAATSMRSSTPTAPRRPADGSGRRGTARQHRGDRPEAWYSGHPVADREVIEAAVALSRSVASSGLATWRWTWPACFRYPRSSKARTCRSTCWMLWRLLRCGRSWWSGGEGRRRRVATRLRELNTLAGHGSGGSADMTDDAAEEHGDNDRRNLAELRGWVGHEPRPGTIPLRLQFHRRPVRLLGVDRATVVAPTHRRSTTTAWRRNRWRSPCC